MIRRHPSRAIDDVDVARELAHERRRGVQDYAHLLRTGKANQTRLKTTTEYIGNLPSTAARVRLPTRQRAWCQRRRVVF